MLYFLSRAVLLASRFLIAADDWGFGAAWSFVVRSKFSGETAGVALRGVSGRFRHRGPKDRSVLTQFCQDFGYLDPAQGAPIRTIVDAGANIGVFSAFARSLYPDAHVFALEIEPDNLVVLSRNAAEMGNIEVIPAALWKARATLNIRLASNADGHSVSDDPDAGPNRVSAIGLHDLLSQYGLREIDLLKMDIEGAEAEVVEALSDEDLSRINAIRFECADNDAPGNTLRLCRRLLAQDFDAFAFGENVYLVRRRTGWIFRRRYAGVGAFPRLRSTQREPGHA